MRRRQKTLLVADVFAGAGGLSVGFTQAKLRVGKVECGYKVVYATDHDKQALETYKRNHFDLNAEQHDPRVDCQDVEQINAKRILSSIRPLRRVDILIGGPSCQGVSPAGLRNPGDKRNRMLLAFARLVKELRPKWFVMENVPGLTHENNRELLAEVFKLFEGIKGYTISGDVLLAAEHGVPQFRYRLFVVGTRTKKDIRFPRPKHAAAGRGKKPFLTVRDAIGDLSAQPAKELSPDAKPSLAKEKVPNHSYRGITKINRLRIAGIEQGRDWRDMPIKLLPDRFFATRSSDQKGAYGRLNWDWPAYTVTNSALNVSAGAFTHPEHDRCLSVREAARLQSFPDDYVFCGSAEAQYRQVGNAVPPLMAQALAQSILRAQFAAKLSAKDLVGRLTRKVVEDALNGNTFFPKLTPRMPHPEQARSTARKTSNQSVKQASGAKRIWKANPRPSDPWPEQTRRLRQLASQPKNVRAAKRARSIVQFIDGLGRAKIVQIANASEKSVRDWVEGYFRHGLEGWRAHHSGLAHLAGNNPEAEQRLNAAVKKSRQLVMAPKKSGATTETNRLHMNAYLRGLVSRFGDHSVTSLMKTVEARAGLSVGTVYVGDLLAIADVVLAPFWKVAQKAPHVDRKGAVAPPKQKMDVVPAQERLRESFQVFAPGPLDQSDQHKTRSRVSKTHAMPVLEELG
ncbi:MAG TPA: DNA cytosine methyltransferase [Verrucomicrobiae bacterium]|nr:DNA cytosine methyltransferase [Verrucomicrobiae bacterium]